MENRPLIVAAIVVGSVALFGIARRSSPQGEAVAQSATAKADGEVKSQGVLIRIRPAFLAVRPRVYLVPAGDDAVVARRRDDFGVGRRKRYTVLRLIFVGHQLLLLASFITQALGSTWLSLNPNISDCTPVA